MAKVVLCHGVSYSLQNEETRSNKWFAMKTMSNWCNLLLNWCVDSTRYGKRN